VIALLDADTMAYRAAAACEEEDVKVAYHTVDSIVTGALLSCDYVDRWYDQWKLYLSGDTNFRKTIATTAPYKGNRTQPKPKHLKKVKAYLKKQWKAVVAVNEEADDLIAIESTKLQHQCCIISVDKDFKQIPTHFYNYVKREHLFITPDEAIKFFYQQILMGDSADNIIGIKGVGPVKAARMLEDVDTEVDMFNVCVEAYEGNVDRVVENGRLLWLRRHKGQMWTPPTKEQQ
jgi:DNA polymerase-1